MSNKHSTLYLIKYLWNYLTLRRRVEFWMIFILNFITAVLEVIGIGLILPFLTMLSNPEDLLSHQYVKPVVEFLNIVDISSFVSLFTTVFITSIVIAALFRLLLLYLITRFSHSLGSEISLEIFRRTLYQDFSVHVSRNSSEVINSIVMKSNIAVGVIQSLMTIISSLIMIVIVLFALLRVDSKSTLILLFGTTFIYLMVSMYTRIKIKSNSVIISKNSNIIIRLLQEGLGNIRDVIIDGSQNYYCNEYRKVDFPLRRALGDNQFIGSSPRYVVEAIGMILIIAVAVNMAEGSNYSNSIPILGLIALAMQKTLPMLQQGYKGITVIKSSYASFKDVVDLLQQPLPNYLSDKNKVQVTFNKEIILSNLSFRHSDNTPWVLKNIDLNIKKGSVIGIVGETGSGKSTLVDIIMGLIKPTKGNLIIDDKLIDNDNKKSWQLHIAHVPQNIYLLDSSIEQNIAFGESKEDVDINKIKSALKMSQIDNMVDFDKENFSSSTGERGIKLSGGQRQRVGIARAFYKNSEVLVLDEATSALDETTEKKIMESIDSLDKKLTVIIIAHRLSTLKNCDYIYKISNSKIERVKSFENLYDKKK